VWTTDKDGLIMGLLAAEISARTGRDPNQFYLSETSDLGTSFYERIDAPASRDQKAILAKLDPAKVEMVELAGEPVQAKVNRAPGDGEPIGGIKVTTANGWFAARPSGTEEVYKLYAESFRSEAHLRAIQAEAQAFISNCFRGA
jgi:phosphoglucomutase